MADPGKPDTKHSETSEPLSKASSLPATDSVRDRVTSKSENLVEITHPFHPWRGRKFHREGCDNGGDELLVRCIKDEQTVVSVPRAWTNLREVDDFERISAGRVLFRADKLVALREIMEELPKRQE